MKNWPIIFAICTLLASCGSNPHRPATQGQPVLKLVRQAQGPNANGGLSSENKLYGVETVPSLRGKDFSVASRTQSIEQFPCSRCHDRPIAQMKLASQAKVGTAAAHWNIRLLHAPAGVMSCESCHSGSSPDTLHSLRGEAIDFNHSYELCAQCHTKQVADWTGGAHGKRLGGWAPPRVVANCAACHNPHDPKLKSRWPAIAAKTKGISTHE